MAKPLKNQPAPASEAGGNSPSPSINVSASPGADRPGIRLKLNRAQLAALALAEVICRIAQKAAYAPVLNGHQISAPFVNQLLTDATATRSETTDAVACTGGGEAATAGQTGKKKTLMRRLRRIQAAAKQKHQYLDPQRLADYLVGQPIGQSRAFLMQASDTIISKANQERPPGIDTDFIAAATTERTQYIDAKSPQENEKAAAKQARANVKSFVASVAHRRKEIQLAADSAWPAGVQENVEVRKLFLIPPNRTLSR